MTSNWKLVERIVAAAVFVWALVLYLLTVSPTASFWDSGEFIAIANRLQVSHPPGAPFYMLVGRLFSMFVPTAYISFAVNLVSVLASAFTVLLTHLIVVRLAREWRSSENPSGYERFTVLAGGVIGSLTFAATDSFWFNAVEAEVYAMSMFFTAAVVWLIMKWSEQARLEAEVVTGRQHPFGLSANRYLVLIAYMFGLAIGVHLLNLLAIFFIALIFYFVEFTDDEKPERMGFGSIFRAFTSSLPGILIAGLVSSMAFLAIYPGIITWLPGVVGSSGAPLFVVSVILLSVIGGLYYTQRNGLQVLNLVMLCITVVLIGYSTYALIFIRSASNPPIDENDPETVEAIVSYLKREQYGETPILRGHSFDNSKGQIDTDRQKIFPRRHSPAGPHLRVYAQYASDWEFFLKYQVVKMYFRYFGWNFVGRGSDVQDAPSITGFSFLDPPEYSADRYVQTPSERSSRNAYFMLPLLLGIFGATYHLTRDWKRAFSVFILFFVTGLGIILYLNQTPLQPRERDYSYVASFFAFSLWVGIGATGVLQFALELLNPKDGQSGSSTGTTLYGIGALLFLAVPLWMTVENFHDHNRSGRYVAPEYAHNMLMSVADDAILITNGDNDTFPLWYLQEVEGVRQDVRVVNISLLNTPWYINQLKNQASRESEPLPISLPDDEIRDIEIIAWNPQEVELPVEMDKILGTSEVPIALDDTSLLQSPMKWYLEGRPYSDQINLLYVADQALLNILHTNAQEGWKRPFYFAVTVSDDGKLDLQNYFQLEGQAFRVVPIKHDEDQLGRVVPEITVDRLKQFKFTNLNAPDIYFDENIRRMVDNYRNIFVQTAQTLIRNNDREEALSLMEHLMTNIPFETIPGTIQSHLIVARAFQELGDRDQAMELWKKAEPLVLRDIQLARTQASMQRVGSLMQMLQLGYIEEGEYEAAAEFSADIAKILGDETYSRTAQDFQRDAERIFGQDSTALTGGN